MILCARPMLAFVSRLISVLCIRTLNMTSSLNLPCELNVICALNCALTCTLTCALPCADLRADLDLCPMTAGMVAGPYQRDVRR